MDDGLGAADDGNNDSYSDEHHYDYDGADDCHGDYE